MLFGWSTTALVVAAAMGALTGRAGADTWALPPINAKADYQLGGDYPPPKGVTVVSRDWFEGLALKTGYTICYVNAFQTQPDEPRIDRPDETSNWPADLVLTTLGDDPDWPGEFLIDISTDDKRRKALAHVKPMINTCTNKGFDAVEFDNLDSWTRFDGTPKEARVPFGKPAAIAYARLLTAYAHSRRLASAQKNTPQLGRHVSRTVIAFDFVVSEECGRYNECAPYVKAFDRRIIAIEYTNRGFDRACAAIGASVSVVLRDLDLARPPSRRYRYRSC